MSFRVELERLFTGPVDLLLYLVRRHELDVRDLPVAAVTRQFREMITALELIGDAIDLDLAGEFVVTAATLAEIKSQLALPSEEEDADEPDEVLPDEPQSDLVARLLEYKRFKDAAAALQERADRRAERYPRIPEEVETTASDPAAARIRDVELWDLLSAFARIAETQLDRGVTTIRDDQTPVHVYVEQVGERVRREGEVRFSDLFEGERERSRVVGLFLAVLELVRHHGFRATQEVRNGEILITPPEDAAEGGE